MQDDTHAPSHEAPGSDEALYALLLDVCHFTLSQAIVPAAAEQEEERQRQVTAALTALQRLLAPAILSKGLCSVDQCADVLGWILSFLQQVQGAEQWLPAILPDIGRISILLAEHAPAAFLESAPLTAALAQLVLLSLQLVGKLDGDGREAAAKDLLRALEKLIIRAPWRAVEAQHPQLLCCALDILRPAGIGQHFCCLKTCIAKKIVLCVKE